MQPSRKPKIGQLAGMLGLLSCLCAAQAQSQVYVQRATAANTAGNSTFLTPDPNPWHLYMITANWNPPGFPGVYNNHATGVWFSAASHNWAIFNQDIAAMPLGASFNVWIPAAATNVYTHRVTAANRVSNWTYIDNIYTNSNPGALVFVTPNWNPGGIGVYDNHPLGVWYDTVARKWAIFNQDLVLMPLNAAFNVVIESGQNPPHFYIHKATTANIVSNWTYLDNVNLNGNPKAKIFATCNWNPGGVGGIYNKHHIGVWYDSRVNRWAVFNQDLAAMPVGAAFNIWTIP